MDRVCFAKRALGLTRSSYAIDRYSCLSRAHERYYGEDLSDAGDSHVIEQPLNRGTGIAIILALLHVLQRDHDALVAFFPCDHFYADDDSFRLTDPICSRMRRAKPRVDHPRGCRR